MDICINRTILQRILNDDVESELKQIIDDELSKPDLEIDCSKIDDCIKAINLLRAENSI